MNQSVVDAIKAVDGDLSQLSDDIIPQELKNRFCTAFDRDQFKLIESLQPSKNGSTWGNL